MKTTKKTLKKTDERIETLKFWKHSSTKAKLDWLESALIFGKLKKFRKTS